MALIRGGIKVKPHVQAACEAIQIATGADSFGTYPGHSPPEGPTQAVDIFNPDTPTGHALQDRICTFIIDHAELYGLRYVIRRQGIYNVERKSDGWRFMPSRGSRTNDHYDHVHLTFYARGLTRVPPVVPPIIKRKDTEVLIYGTPTEGEETGGIWLLMAGESYRFHLPADVQRCKDQGIPDLGEMSMSFHHLFPRHG